jgi:hypothetical protein
MIVLKALFKLLLTKLKHLAHGTHVPTFSWRESVRMADAQVGG